MQTKTKGIIKMQQLFIELSLGTRNVATFVGKPEKEVT